MLDAGHAVEEKSRFSDTGLVDNGKGCGSERS